MRAATRLRRWPALSLAALVAVLVSLLTPLTAAAHPLGNFTVNTYSRLELYGDRVRVRYVIDMAEIPTFQAMPSIDTDGDGTVSAAENAAYRASAVEAARQNLALAVNGTALPLETLTSDLSFPVGQGNLQTLRLTAWFEAPLSAAQGEALGVQYADRNPGERIGWHEIVLAAAAGLRVDASDVSATEVSDELRSYPQDMLNSPLDERAANVSVTVVALAASLAGATPAEAGAPVVKPTDPFAQLVHIEDLGPGVVLLALLAALAYGMLHAFTPGHGKAMVGAYLVGSRGTPKHALLLGLTVTITHTIGVYALGAVTLFLSAYILPERLYPILSMASGLLVVVIGASLFLSRWRASHRPAAVAHTHGPNDPTGHAHGGTAHTHMLPAGQTVTVRSLLALGISGGLIPCPTALLVMLGAIALNRVAFGLVLILAFSLGLAAVLVSTGLALVWAGRWMERRQVNERMVRWIGAASALAMTVIGLAAMVGALRQLI
jgi:ABC-type nickel/cobalt efflux system permease component RcnA